MKNIQTHYKGYHFRSRLEARVAVYLNHIGWKWRYEHEGFEFEDGTRYLPDFEILAQGVGSTLLYVEVKGAPPTDDEMEKAKRLAVQSGVNVGFIIGEISKESLTEIPAYVGGTGDETELSLSEYCLTKWGRPGYWMQDIGSDGATDPAINAARSARFEFGGA